MICVPDDGTEKSQLSQSKAIDRALAKDKQVLKSQVQLLLLGKPRAGKTTLVKQLRIKHGDTFSQVSRWFELCQPPSPASCIPFSQYFSLSVCGVAVCLSVSLSLSVFCLSVCLSFCLSVCLSVCLCVRVISVILKRPLFPPCAVDGLSLIHI